MVVVQRRLDLVTSYRFEDISHYSQLDPIIVQAIVGCVRSAFEGGVTDDDALHHIQGDLVTVDIDEATGRALAFSSTDFGSPNDIFDRNDITNEYGCYLAGATVAKEAQGLGLYKRMNERRIRAALEQRVKLVFTRTQNPRVQAGIEATLTAFRNQGLILGYSMRKILVPGCYGEQLTKTRPQDDKISFDELDYKNGDATPEQIAEKITRDGFRRIKMKIGPTPEDYQRVATVRQLFPSVLLMVDANSSFDTNNPQHRQLLEAYGRLDLLMIEQPLAHNDIANHVQLQQFFEREGIPGRVCLDESIHTLEDLRQAINGGIPIINIKVTRVGGLDIARTMIEECRRAEVDVWIGGMMELTAPGKAHSLAMATHPGVTLPSDISGTAAYFKPGEDPCTSPMEREGAYITVPDTPGRGWEVDIGKMDKITQKKVVFNNR